MATLSRSVAANLSPRTLELIALARAKHAAASAQSAPVSPSVSPSALASNIPASQLAPQVQLPASQVQLPTLHLSTTSNLGSTSSAAAPVFNPEQLAAIEFGLQGKSFCLIGAAGTGKTTVTQEIISRLQRASHVMPLSHATKHLNKDAPGIVICGFTNKAVNNIRKKLPAHLQGHCMTIHKLLEYAPVYYEVPDPETGGFRTTMRFEPSMNGANPLPHISTIIFEESSMIGTDLYSQVLDALPRRSATQFVFLGDLNQIPPVFGPSILGFKLGEMPTVELTHVYRQALLSPIISLATSVRTNALKDLPNKLTEKVVLDSGEHGKVTLHPWKKRVSNLAAIAFMRSFLPTLISSGQLDPEQDIILCPFNKSFGTIELNKIMADYLGKQRDAVVFEVIARYQKSYWAVGDRVMVDRHEAKITKITRTIGYAGKLPVTESKTLDRWGVDSEHDAPAAMTADEILNSLDGLGQDDEGKNLASHTIEVYIPDLDETRALNTAGDINTMLFGYALTIHKSQGSEWQRVFLFLHNSHATMISRELVYTAVTRAKQELYVICEGDIAPYKNSVVAAAARPVIPGTTLADKIEFFKGKKAAMNMGDEA
jgi:exodeoxyribonuclease V alpha subunit